MKAAGYKKLKLMNITAESHIISYINYRYHYRNVIHHIISFKKCNSFIHKIFQIYISAVRPKICIDISCVYVVLDIIYFYIIYIYREHTYYRNHFINCVIVCVQNYRFLYAKTVKHFYMIVKDVVK